MARRLGHKRSSAIGMGAGAESVRGCAEDEVRLVWWKRSVGSAPNSVQQGCELAAGQRSF